MDYKKALYPLALLSSGIVGSHLIQVANIQRNCEKYKSAFSETLLSPEEEISRCLEILNSHEYKDSEDVGGWDFVVGDFSAHENKVRCGGSAKIFAEGLAKRGFETRIHFEFNSPISAHYYASASRNGETWNLVGAPPNCKVEKVGRSESE